ncbi:hypothetical protein FACS189413_14580 [Bacteroidia bacterium]|nr:hypothetical protein FACS189413_14580 [Bacteroidia bacterium]
MIVIQYIAFTFITVLVFSCSDKFLDETLDIAGIATSAIIISPEWESGNYQFQCENVGNSDFTIESKPQWLTVDNNSGKFADGIATITCQANYQDKYAKTGIYIDQMMVVAGGKKYAIPLYYINEGEPRIAAPASLTIRYSNYSNTLTIGNTGDGILLWDVISLPEWLTIDRSQRSINNLMIAQNGSAAIPFTFNPNAVITNDLSGVVVLRTNDKTKPTISIAVTADLGSPEISLYFYSNQIDFGATTTTYSLDIDAWGSGVLVWHFEEIPEWLTITPPSGIYQTHTYYDNIIFTCDRTKLQPGLNSAIIYLKSNAYNQPSIAITVIARAPGSNANIRALEGNIVDATFDKSTNTLYYATSTPNKLVAYDVANRTVLHEVTLSKVPTCLSITEDVTKAVVGHGGMVSVVNLIDYAASTIDINGTVYDIAFGDADWACYTLEMSGYSYTRWVNATTGAKSETNGSHSLYDGSIIKKVPTQPYIVATMRGYSPSGFYTLDASTKTLKSYSHMDLSDFWFSEDGQYTFSLNGNIYRTSNAINSNDTFDANVNSIGRLSIPTTSYFNPFCVEHSLLAHTIWAISNANSYYESGNSSIYQFDDNDFSFQKSYFYSDLYQPDAQTAAYEVQAQYIFANGAGTELSVLRKGTNNNSWSIEFIEVRK